jgi:hypothetical protein
VRHIVAVRGADMLKAHLLRAQLAHQLGGVKAAVDAGADLAVPVGQQRDGAGGLGGADARLVAALELAGQRARPRCAHVTA